MHQNRLKYSALSTAVCERAYSPYFLAKKESLKGLRQNLQRLQQQPLLNAYAVGPIF
jgi:hypothetical protein